MAKVICPICGKESDSIDWGEGICPVCGMKV
jgi:DNA-directed RNA polymerase subunit RPC12/RpoP